MRILLIHNRERKTGGESVAFDRECRALRTMGHHLLTLQKSNRDFELASVWRKAWMSLASVFNIADYFGLRRTIRKFEPDVAIVHNPFPLWSVSSYLALLVERVPIIQVVHNFRLRCLNGLYFRDGAPCTLCSNGRWWHGVRHRCVHGSQVRSLASGVITQTIWPLRVVHRIRAYRALSMFSRDRLIEMGLESDRIRVIPNMAPQLDFKPDPTPEPSWVFMGHLGPAKGPQVAVEALARGAPGKLIFVGGGPLAAQLRQRSKDQGLRIEFLGDQNGEERFDVLRQAWALILPSLCFENGPLVALEAFSIGIPVVASRIGSIPEYVTDGVSGRLFNPGDDEDLAHILTELASDATQRARLSSGAREVFRQRYAEREIAAQLEALLEATALRSRNWGS